LAGGDRDPPDRVVIGVGHEQVPVGCGEAAGLRELRARASPVREAGDAIPGERPHAPGPGIEHTNLVVVGVGHVNEPVGHQRMLKPRPVAGIVDIAELEKVAASVVTSLTGGSATERTMLDSASAT
jgi:hypothetical protein